MKRWQWWAAGVFTYVLILLAIAPATLLDALIDRASGGRVRIAAARGSVWSGTGELQLLDTNRQNGVSESIGWRILPLSLLRTRVDCEITLGVGAKSFTLSLRPARIEVADANISLPAALLGIIEPSLAPFGFGGEMVLHITELTIGRTDWQASATVVWRAASSVHSRVAPLGDYELRVAPVGSGTSMQLRTLAGPLQIDGTGSWTRGSRPAFDATARVGPQYREQLEPMLRMIARDRGAGNYELVLQ